MAERSKELIQVGYFLSRFGVVDPPSHLKTDKWYMAYRMFYEALNGGRTVLEFEHSLKNSRDDFDGFFPETQREGWKAKDGAPAKLSGIAEEVFNSFESKSVDEVWSVVSRYADPDYAVSPAVFDDLIGEDTANSNSDDTTTEGGMKVRISKSYERSAKLRQQAVEIHGYSCQVCGFDFKKTFGKWGENFAEVHHIKPLHELDGTPEVVNPHTDLAVLCANCHRMVHRKKKTTLSIDELKQKLQSQ